MGCYDKAIKIFQKRLIDFDKILGINHIETTWVKSYIGNTLYFLEKYNEALPIFKETVTAVEKEFGSENEHSIWERVWLAVTLEKAGKNKEAEKYYEKLVNDCEKNAKLDILTKNKIFLYFIEYLGKNKKYKKISHYIGPCILIAEVIITKSDRIAISLYFNEEIMHAPTITVLGKNTVAQSIIQMAHDKKIPIIEDSVLAAQMIDEFEPGDVITEQYYKALAKIFAQVRGYEQCIDEPISDNIKETVDKIMK
jgi:type III secretion system FlhB-like substrate exporter